MNCTLKNIAGLFLFCVCYDANAQQSFKSLEDLWLHANRRSTTVNSGNIKLAQAKTARIAAILGIVDLSVNNTLNVTHNTTLPVSLFPAEAFGGKPGTYQEIRTGIPYTNTLNQSAEIKLFNMGGWQSLKLASLNLELAATDKRIAEKALYESIASTYFNITALQEQLVATQTNARLADTIYLITRNKTEMGVARMQDLNDARVNFINTNESASQIEYLLKQQYLALKILCDIPDSIDIKVEQPLIETTQLSPRITYNSLNVSNSLLKEKYALNNYHQVKYASLPYISAFYSNSYQQFNNDFSLFDKNVKWINSNFIGIKAVWQITAANTISQIGKAKYDYLLTKENSEHTRLKSDMEQQSLKLEFEKSLSQMKSNKVIQDLRRDSYNKNMENYVQGSISLEHLLNSYIAKVNSEYSYFSAVAEVMLVESKIMINNTIQ